MSKALTRPRQFWKEYVLPNYREFLRAPTSKRKAMNAAVSAVHMADYVWKTYHATDPVKVFGKRKISEFRTQLDGECADFRLFTDVANAHKHMVLTMHPPRREWVVTSAGAVLLDWAKLGNEPIPIKVIRQRVIVVNQADGTRVQFAPALKNVVEMWERLIAQQGW